MQETTQNTAIRLHDYSDLAFRFLLDQHDKRELTDSFIKRVTGLDALHFQDVCGSHGMLARFLRDRGIEIDKLNHQRFVEALRLHDTKNKLGQACDQVRILSKEVKASGQTVLEYRSGFFRRSPKGITVLGKIQPELRKNPAYTRIFTGEQIAVRVKNGAMLPVEKVQLTRFGERFVNFISRN